MRWQSRVYLVVLTICIVLSAVAVSVLWVQMRAANRPPSGSSDNPRTVATRTRLEPRTVGKPYFSSPLCIAGCPSGANPKDQIVTHHILVLANNPDTKFADWVAYRITPDILGSHCKREWQADPDIDPNNTLRPSDYAGIREALQSDRGHQAPLASLCGSPYWQEADYLSNITPQKTDLNEGAWEKLEDAERGLVSSGQVSAVYSVTGTLYERPMPGLPRAHIAGVVPSGYWKVIAIERDGGIEAAGFIMGQMTVRNASYCDQLASIAEVEKRGKMQLFPESITMGIVVKERNLPQALGC